MNLTIGNQLDMNGYRLSAHANARLRQRGISSEAMAVVLGYGESDRAHGADRFFLPAKARAALTAELDIPRGALDRLNLNVVVADNGTVVTVAHALRRRRRLIQERWSRTNPRWSSVGISGLDKSTGQDLSQPTWTMYP